MNQTLPPQHIVTRFAPSPTGKLHIGHGWSALLAMDFARANGGSFQLRIEDIDGTRSRPEHVAGIIEDLNWLGVDWNDEIVFQSDRLGRYEAALARLRDMDLLYPCFCTRADIAAGASAPTRITMATNHQLGRRRVHTCCDMIFSFTRAVQLRTRGLRLDGRTLGILPGY